MSKEAMQQALEHLKIAMRRSAWDSIILLDDALLNIDEWAAQQPTQQEPVGVFREDDDIGHVDLCPHQQMKLKDGDKLYTSPPAQRTWVGLTDEELYEIDGVEMKYDGTGDYYLEGEYEFARAVEAKLKEKNT